MNKTLKLTVALLGFAMIFGSTSCGKYEEGPSLSLRSKKARLANTWTISKTVTNDGDETIWTSEEKENYTMEIKKDGTYSFEAKYTFGGTTTTFTDNGTWEFIDGKEKIKTTDSDGNTSEATIILLKNKEWASKDEDGDKAYYEAK